MALIDLPDPEVVVPDDADFVFDIEYDGSLTGVPLLLTVREDPSWSTRYKTLVTDELRKWLSDDLSTWSVVFSSTTTTTPADGHAAAIVAPRASVALLSPGKYRYVAEIARTDSGNVSPVVPPFWLSVRAAVSRP